MEHGGVDTIPEKNLKTYTSKEIRKEIILLFTHFKLKLVVCSGISYYFQLLKIAVVEFPTVFVIKFLSGMSLPWKINGNSSFCSPRTRRVRGLVKTTVPIYFSR